MTIQPTQLKSIPSHFISSLILRNRATENDGERKKPSFQEKTRFPFAFCTFFLHETIFYVWTTILVVMGSADFAEAQRNSTSVSGTLSSEADERFARALEPMTFQFPRDHGAHPEYQICLLYTSPSPRDGLLSRMPSSA